MNAPIHLAIHSAIHAAATSASPLAEAFIEIFRSSRACRDTTEIYTRHTPEMRPRCMPEIQPIRGRYAPEIQPRYSRDTAEIVMIQLLVVRCGLPAVYQQCAAPKVLDSEGMPGMAPSGPRGITVRAEATGGSVADASAAGGAAADASAAGGAAADAITDNSAAISASVSASATAARSRLLEFALLIDGHVARLATDVDGDSGPARLLRSACGAFRDVSDDPAARVLKLVDETSPCVSPQA